jgi:hypothetical protein
MCNIVALTPVIIPWYQTFSIATVVYTVSTDSALPAVNDIAEYCSQFKTVFGVSIVEIVSIVFSGIRYVEIDL